MAKPGRKPLAVPKVQWQVAVRIDIAAKVELLLMDPMREKTKYGARGELIEILLEEWVRKQELAFGKLPE